MASTRRQALEDDLSLAQEEADQALHGLEAARRRLEDRMVPLSANDPDRFRRVEFRVAPLRREADTVVTTWVDAASHDLYRDPEGSLVTSTRALRSTVSDLVRLQQAWESLEEELAAELAAFEAQLVTARQDAETAVAAARAVLAEVRSEGLSPSKAEKVLLDAEQLSRSPDPRQLLKAAELAAAASESARSLRSLRDDVQRRLTSTRTRFEAAHTKAGKIHEVLTVLRREHPHSAWADVEITEAQASELLAVLAPRLDEIDTRLSTGDADAASALLDRFRDDLKDAEARVTAPASRLQAFKETAGSKAELVSRVRHRVRDAQRLCVSLGTPAREARELDVLSVQLDQATEAVNGRYPDLLRFTRDLDRITQQTQAVVERLRSTVSSS